MKIGIKDRVISSSLNSFVHWLLSAPYLYTQTMNPIAFQITHRMLFQSQDLAPHSPTPVSSKFSLNVYVQMVCLHVCMYAYICVSAWAGGIHAHMYGGQRLHWRYWNMLYLIH